jgi:hypothetical protein
VNIICVKIVIIIIIIIAGKTAHFEPWRFLEDSARFVIRFSLLWISRLPFPQEQGRQPS